VYRFLWGILLLDDYWEDQGDEGITLKMDLRKIDREDCRL
jgi:hypothetical protein